MKGAIVSWSDTTIVAEFDSIPSEVTVNSVFGTGTSEVRGGGETWAFVRGDSIYMLPVNYTPFIIYYSKDLFDKYNVDYPDENWTWMDLREKALALTRDRNGRRPADEDFNSNEVVSYGFHYAKWQHGVE